MSDFAFKTYRCEWQVNVIGVDQYGQRRETLSSVPFPSRPEAVAYRETVAHPHRFVKERWVPNDQTNSYVECVIDYKEVVQP